jgi:putative Holliday junction resolvase
MLANDIGNNNQVVVGLDIGDTKTGLALGLLANKVAVGLKTTKTNDLKTELTKIIKSNNVTALIIGLPYNLSGQSTEQTKKVMQQIKKIKKWFSLPIVVIDERWTSKQARQQKASDEDVGAAVFITQTYLDKK